MSDQEPKSRPRRRQLLPVGIRRGLAVGGLWLLLLPVRLAAVVWGLISRAVLLLLTLLLCLYFLVTHMVTPELVLELLNANLMGRYSADHIELNLSNGEVQIFNLRIGHPDGHDVIHSRRLETSIDLSALAFWGSKQAVGLSDPLPLRIRNTQLDGYRVVLPFDERGLHFAEAFMPAVVTPDDEPAAPAPDVSLSRIRLGAGEVLIDFSDWQIPVAVNHIAADIRIREGELELAAYSIDIAATRLQKLIPAPADWIGEQLMSLKVGRYRMDTERLEIGEIAIVHPDFRARFERFSLGFGDDSMPVEANGVVELLTPHRLFELTSGQLFGAAEVAVRMFGTITTPDFQVQLRSPWLETQGIELEQVEADVGIDLHGGAFISISKAAAWWQGCPLRLWSSQVDMEFGELPDITVSGCVEGLRPAAVAAAFENDSLLDLGAVTLSGCCHSCRVSLGSGAPRFDGGLSVTVDAGELEGLTGIKGATLESFLSWNGESLRWDGLALTTNLGHLASVGYLNLSGDEPEGRIDGSLTVDELALLPPVAALGLSGSLTLTDLLFTGTPREPTVTATAHADRLRFGDEQAEFIDFKGSYDRGEVAVEELCFSTRGSHGCFSGSTSLKQEPLWPLPVTLTARSPLLIDLARLPFLEMPARGVASVDELVLSAMVSPDLLATLRSLQGRIGCRLNALSWFMPLVAVQELSLELDKQPGEGTGIGPWQAELGWEGAAVAGVEVRSGRVGLEVGEITGLEAGSGEPLFASGRARVALAGIKTEWVDLSRLELALDGSHAPRRLLAQGRAELAEATPLLFSGELDWDSLVSSLQLNFNNFPLSALPSAWLPPALASLLAETQVTATLRAARIDWRAISAGHLTRALAQLRAEGRLSVVGLHSLPEPVERVESAFVVDRGALRLKPLEARLANGTAVRFIGTLWPLREQVAGSLSVSGTRLSSLRTVGALDLPVDAVVAMESALDGAWRSPKVDSALRVVDLVAAGFPLGSASLRVHGQVGEEMAIESSEFFPGLGLTSGVMAFDGQLPSGVDLDLTFARLGLERILPELPEQLQVAADGGAHLKLRFGGGDPFSLAVALPAKGLSACLQLDVVSQCFGNPEPAALVVNSEGVEFQALELEGGGHKVGGLGRLGFSSGWDLELGLEVDLARLGLLGDYLASYQGRVGTLGTPARLVGPLDAPRLAATIRLVDVVVQPRYLGTEIAIPDASIRVSGQPMRGDLVALVEEDLPANGSYDEGLFSLHGWLRMVGWVPDSVLLFLTGKELDFTVPGQYRLVFSPRLEFSGRHLGSAEAMKTRLSGDLFISEGEFTRNFDRLIGSFATAFSRSQERYSKPITESFPWLNQLALDLRVTGGNFAISSRFPFGETELVANMDLAISGTLDELKLNDWMRLVPGGTITYKVVKRVFSVTRGNIDFSGTPETPYIDVEAVTEVPYTRSVASGAAVDLDEEAWGETIPIKIRMTGIYPNLTPEFSSDKPGFDDADLQTLLLLGMTRKDLEGRSEDSSRSDISINLLTEDVAGMVSNLLLAAFVDTVSLGFTQQGGILAEAATRIGRAISLSTRVRKDSESEQYSAGIKFKITDRLSLEGRMKKEEDRFDSQTLYEAKFKYLVPLD